MPDNFREKMERIRDEALQEVAEAKTLQELAQIKNKYFGKQGIWKEKVERKIFPKD